MLDKTRRPVAGLLAKLLKFEQSQNIAEMLDDDELNNLGSEVERDYQIDKKSREEWEASAERAMDIALQVRKPKNYPFENASNIKYPLVTVAALQFGARAYPAIVDGNRIVKAQVLGRDEDGQKRAKADRVSQHMSWQLLEQMEEWEEDTDVLIHHLPIVGCAFRKVYRSEELRRCKAEMIPAIHLVVNNKVRSLDEAPRVTHELFIYPQDIEDRKRNGTFLNIDLPAPTDGDGSDEDAPHTFLEQHRYLDLDEDGYREPYIITVHAESCKVVRIVANYRIEDVVTNDTKILRIPKRQYFVKYSFLPNPAGGFYDIGFGKLLESISETIDTTINQMIDAGHIQNAGGGFIGTGLRLKTKEVKLSPGKYQQVATAGDIRSQIYTHQFPGPSPVLFNLLGMMVDAARDITAVKDILTGDAGDTRTATATLALIEQGLKVFTAIYKRIYRALRDEFRLLFELNAEYLDEKEYFTFHDEPQAVSRSDYDIKSLDIRPVADPKMVTDMQRAARSGVLMEIAGHPVLGPVQNPREALKRIYDSAGVEAPEQLIISEPQGPNPMEQLAMADAEAEVGKKQAAAAKDQSAAVLNTIEAEMMPMQAAHDAIMQDRQQTHAEAMPAQ